MAKRTLKLTRNPADATMRNVRAANRRDQLLDTRIGVNEKLIQSIFAQIATINETLDALCYQVDKCIKRLK